MYPNNNVHHTIMSSPVQPATSTFTIMMTPTAAATPTATAIRPERTIACTRAGAICPTSCWRTSSLCWRCAIATMPVWCAVAGTRRSTCRACGRTLWSTIARWRPPSSTTIRAGSMCSITFARRIVWRASASICAVWSFDRCTVSTICFSSCRYWRGTWIR